MRMILLKTIMHNNVECSPNRHDQSVQCQQNRCVLLMQCCQSHASPRHAAWENKQVKANRTTFTGPPHRWRVKGQQAQRITVWVMPYSTFETCQGKGLASQDVIMPICSLQRPLQEPRRQDGFGFASVYIYRLFVNSNLWIIPQWSIYLHLYLVICLSVHLSI